MILTNNENWASRTLDIFYKSLSSEEDQKLRQKARLLSTHIASTHTRSIISKYKYIYYSEENFEENFKNIFSTIISDDAFKNKNEMHLKYLIPPKSVNFLSFSDKIAFIDTNSFFVKSERVNSLPVFSIFPKNIYDLFSNKIIIESNFPYDYESVFDQNGSEEYFFEEEEGKSLAKFTNYRFAQALFVNNSNPITENLRQSFSSDTSKYTVIQPKSVCTGSDIDYSIEIVKGSKFKRPSNCVIPALYKASYYNFKSKAFKDCYIFGFVFDIEKAKWTKYSKPKKIYDAILQSIYDFGLIDLTDTETFFKVLSNKIGYSNVENLSRFQIDFYLNYVRKLKVNFDKLNVEKKIISDQSLLDTYSETKYPQQFQNKYNILKLKISQSKDLQNQMIDEYSNYIYEFYNNFLKPIYLTQNKIRYAQEIIEKQNEQIETAKQQKENYLSNLETFSFDKEIKSKLLFKEVNKVNKYLPVYESLLSQKEEYSRSLQKVPNETLSNLLNDINILDISYKHKYNSNIVKTIKNHEIEEYSLNEIIFSNNSFLKIRKNNTDRYYLGGPYIFKYSNHSLHIKLKDKTSYFGVNQKTNWYYLHPHAQSVGYPEQMYANYARCCLGESQSMLYSAAISNNINHLIVNILLWAKSCNSTDYWGRNYRHFQKFSDINFQPLPSLFPQRPKKQEDLGIVASDQGLDIQNQAYTRYIN